jgi:glycogen debranching enzyme
MNVHLIKDGDLFLLTDQAGNITKNENMQYGLYTKDTRFLSRYELFIENIKPFILSFDETEDRINKIDLINANNKKIGSKEVLIKREQIIFDGMVYDRIFVKNYFSQPLGLKLILKVEADYLDIFQVRNYVKVERLGAVLNPSKVKNGIVLGYLGKDGVKRETAVKILNKEGKIYEDRIELFFKLKHNQENEVTIGIMTRVEGQKLINKNIISFERAQKKLRSNYKKWEEDSLTIKTDHKNLNQLINRSLSDLKLLLTDLGEGIMPTAGIPWYAVPFGRDSIIASLQTLMVNTKIAQGTLKTLARFQGKEVNGYREEEPGKIMHEIRFGELANLNLIPYTPYYGTVDATPLFLILAVEYFHWTGDLIFIRKILPNLSAALEWIDKYGDLDKDGYVEYGAKNTKWAINQGWKDSTDSSVHQDGSLAIPPIALVEVQGYIYQAKKGMAEMFFYLGEKDKAKKLEKDARELKDGFNRDFWMEDREYFAFGLDYQKKQIASITSNPGHCLYSGIISQDKSEAVVKKLLNDEMFNGWGIRTMGKNEIGYNPASYHNGSVWPHDNSIIIKGLIRYNYHSEAVKVINGLIKASQYFKYNRLPELFSGFSRKEMKGPIEYPVACSPQAWACGSIYLIIQSLLGLNPDLTNHRIYLKPILPDEINKVEIKNLKIGGNKVDFTLIKEGSHVKLSKAKVEGSIKLILRK